jgi:ABC-2 family transporter
VIWLTWRQFRAPVLVVFATLATGILALAVTGPRLSALLTDSGQTFFAALDGDWGKRTIFLAGTALVYAIPAVVGVFWGAPMIAREVEAGTSRLVWTQSITRSRWLATKLGLSGAAAALAGLTGLALTWWCAPLDRGIAKGYEDQGPFGLPRIWPSLFGARGIVPMGVAVLALVIGVTVGMLLRRTVAAMAVTLVLVVAVQIVMPQVVQAHLLSPKRIVTSITGHNMQEVTASAAPGSRNDVIIERIGIAVDLPGAWLIQNRTYDAAGKVVESFPAWVTDCAPPPGTPKSRASRDACFDRLKAEGYVQRVDYQPASRFWPLQLIETGILLVVALLLTAFCLWRIRRDLT